MGDENYTDKHGRNNECHPRKEREEGKTHRKTQPVFFSKPLERDPVRRDSRMHAVAIDNTTTDYEALRGPSGPAD